MATTFVHLISELDEDYRSWNSDKASISRNRSLRTERSTVVETDHDVEQLFDSLGRYFEPIVIFWLGKYFQLSKERVLHHFNEMGRTTYKELDAVSFNNGEPEWIFEIKVTKSFVSRYFKQMKVVRDICKPKWPQLRQCLIVVDSRNFSNPSGNFPLEIDDLRGEITKRTEMSEIPVLLFSLADLIQFAKNHDLLINYDSVQRDLEQIALLKANLRMTSGSEKFDKKLSFAQDLGSGIYLNIRREQENPGCI